MMVHVTFERCNGACFFWKSVVCNNAHYLNGYVGILSVLSDNLKQTFHKCPNHTTKVYQLVQKQKIQCLDQLYQ